MFDSRQYLESLEPPVFIAPDGSRFIGRILSIEEWQPFEMRMQAAGRGELTGQQMLAFMYQITSAFFPRGWRFWTKRWWRPCAWHIRRLPPVGQLRAVYSFMRSQRLALGMEMPTLGPEIQKLIDGDNPDAASPSAGS